ncbi:MAG TPA: hypothetical protein VHZ74_13885 [Bryobacteraceae bacterium]|jgi:hypothetical protein|nr:hypothetical protein [Bryobacteraceae bacterium]
MAEKQAPLTAEQLLELRDDQRVNLAHFATILKNDAGCTSPAEEFIMSLVRYHGTAIVPLTPANIKDDLQTFRENFEQTLESTRHFVSLYPAEVLGDNCGGWSDQCQKLKAIATEADEEWESGAQGRIDMAREALRLYPALVLSDEPWDEIRKSMRA